MSNLERLRKIRDKQESILERTAKKSADKITKKQALEIKRIKAKYQAELDAVCEKKLQERKAINRDYTISASSEMLARLEEDSRILEQRSLLPEINEQDYEKIQKIKRELATISDSHARKSAEKIAFIGLGPDLKKALTLAEESLSRRDITSYITSTNEGAIQCYLITALNIAETPNRLAKSLDSKLVDVLLAEKVDCNIDVNIGKTGTVENCSHREIEFSSENKPANNYYVYVITPKNKADASRLAECLAKKLADENLQPQEFRRANLRHIVEQLEPSVAEYFMSHDKKQIYSPLETLQAYKEQERIQIGIEEAARMLGFNVMATRRLVTQNRLKGDRDKIEIDSLVSYLESKQQRKKQAKTKREEYRPEKSSGAATPKRVNLASMTPEQVESKKQEIYARLDQYTDRLNMSELSRVLGVSGNSTVYYLYPLIEGIEKKVYGKRQRVFVQKEAVRTFINTQYFTKNLWSRVAKAKNQKTR